MEDEVRSSSYPPDSFTCSPFQPLRLAPFRIGKPNNVAAGIRVPTLLELEFAGLNAD